MHVPVLSCIRTGKFMHPHRPRVGIQILRGIKAELRVTGSETLWEHKSTLGGLAQACDRFLEFQRYVYDGIWIGAL